MFVGVKKEVIMMQGAQAFLDSLDERTQVHFVRIKKILAEEGFLYAPYGEKIGGYANLFAIRITHGQNVRFFYCYDTGDAVYVLSGYEKKTEHIPVHEIKQALRLKKELGL